MLCSPPPAAVLSARDITVSRAPLYQRARTIWGLVFAFADRYALP